MLASIVRGMLFLLLIAIILKQYILFWVLLGQTKLKAFKYILPIMEILLLLFMDELFLLPTITIFLILVYKDRGNGDEILNYYRLNNDRFKPDLNNLVKVIVLSPIIILITYTISSIFFSHMELELSDTTKVVQYNKQYIDYIIWFGLICIIAPVIEEFTFRVLIYDSWLSKKFHKRISAVIISSLIFSLTHFDIGLSFYTFISGIVLCFIYDYFGYISTVVVHVFINTYAFLGLMGIIVKGKTKLIFLAIDLIILVIITLNSRKIDFKT